MNLIEKIDFYGKEFPNRKLYINETDFPREMTYGELLICSNRLANYISKKVQVDKSPIIVFGHKNPFMIVCFLACVKSGHPYCPIDISTPIERVKDIIKICNSNCILATEKICIESNNIIDFDEIKKITNDNQFDETVEYCIKEDDIYYIIFTSGSTGIPKGVQISFSALNKFLNWSITLGDSKIFKENKVFLNQAPFSFDLSVMDLYTCLFSGGTLWAIDKKVQENFSILFESLKNSDLNIWVSTPSFASMCLINKDFDKNLLQNVELFFFCGEVLTNKTALELMKRFPNTIILNTYGPTESTVAMTQIILTEEILNSYNPLPVGFIKPGTDVKIINEDGEEVINGEKGEIYIFGDTLSSGYLNNYEHNQKSFSYFKNKQCYKTGDEGYFKDNMLFYCGRVDFQVKLHGYRIELGDIENNILKIKNVKSCVVLPNEVNGIVKNLIAYIVINSNKLNEYDLSQIIRKELEKNIPLYMIPSRYVFLDYLPMTNNGKVDRKKLKEY